MGREIELAERHPIKNLIRVAIVAGVLFAIAKVVMEKKAEYMDLTETQAKDKFVEKMGPRMGDEQAAEVAEEVVKKLVERGLVKADPVMAAEDSEE